MSAWIWNRFLHIATPCGTFRVVQHVLSARGVSWTNHDCSPEVTPLYGVTLNCSLIGGETHPQFPGCLLITFPALVLMEYSACTACFTCSVYSWLVLYIKVHCHKYYPHMGATGLRSILRRLPGWEVLLHSDVTASGPLGPIARNQSCYRCFRET